MTDFDSITIVHPSDVETEAMRWTNDDLRFLRVTVIESPSGLRLRLYGLDDRLAAIADVLDGHRAKHERDEARRELMETYAIRTSACQGLEPTDPLAPKIIATVAQMLAELKYGRAVAQELFPEVTR